MAGLLALGTTIPSRVAADGYSHLAADSLVALIQAGHCAKAESLCFAALDTIAAHRPDSTTQAIAYSLICLMALECQDRASSTEALYLARRAVTLAEANTRIAHGLRAASLIGLAGVAHARGAHDSSVTYLVRAATIVTSIDSVDTSVWASTISGLMTEWPHALADSSHSDQGPDVLLALASLTQRDPALRVWTLIWFGLGANLQGHSELAEQALRIAHATSRALPPSADTLLASAEAHLAAVLATTAPDTARLLIHTATQRLADAALQYSPTRHAILSTVVMTQLTLNDYPGAATSARELYDFCERWFGAGSIECAQALQYESLAALCLGRSDHAYMSAVRRANILREALPPDAPALQAARLDVASALFLGGNLYAALDSAKVVYATVSSLPSLSADDSLRTVRHDALVSMAHIAATLGDLDLAQDYLSQAGVRPPNSAAIRPIGEAAYVRTQILAYSGQFQAAADLADSLWQVRSQALGHRHPDALSALGNWAALAADLGRSTEVVARLTPVAVDLLTSIPRPYNRRGIFHALSMAYFSLDAFDSSLTWASAALDTTPNQIASLGTSRADVLVTAGRAAQKLGMRTRARDYFAAALVEERKRYNSGRVHAGNAALMLMHAARDEGNYAEATRLLQEFKDYWQCDTGSRHLLCLDAYAFESDLSIDNNDASQALAAARAAVRLTNTTAYATNRVSRSQAYATLASALNCAGDPQAADSVCQIAIDLELAADSVSTLRLSRLAEIRTTSLLALGLNIEAAQFSRSAGIFAAMKTPHERRRIVSLLTLSALGYALSDSLETASLFAYFATGIERFRLQEHLRILDPTHGVQLVDSRILALDLLLSILVAGSDTTFVPWGFESVVLQRQLVLDEFAERRHWLRGSAARSVAPIVSAAADARRNLSDAVLGSKPSMLRAWSDSVSHLERLLAEAADVHRAPFSFVVDSGRVARLGAALIVSFVRFADWLAPNDSTADNNSRMPYQYAAFVARPSDNTVHIVRLGSAAIIDSAMAAWYRAVSMRPGARLWHDTDLRALGRTLRDLVWAPVAPYTVGATDIYVAYDGAITGLNLYALPGYSAEFLVDELPTLHHVTAERDLFRAAPIARVPAHLFAVGGIDYTLRQALYTDGVGASAHDAEKPCYEVRDSRWSPLPGSQTEVATVAAQWTRADRGTDQRPLVAFTASVLADSQTTENAVIDGMQSADVVHLATHAFLLETLCESKISDERSITRGNLAARHLPETIVDPLTMCGLVLLPDRAAAMPLVTDGLLTGAEVVALDLGSVQCAILSACNTGRGRVSDTEGVHSLARAFQLAGVRSVVLTAWAIDDLAAADWMRFFYSALVRGEVVPDAVVTACRSFVAYRRSNGESVDPFYWGPFIAVGTD